MRPALLRGLFWVSRDINDVGDRQLQPDAAALNTVRQHLEHKYLKVHESEWAITQGDPLWTDTLAYSIYRKELEKKALRLAKMARAGLLYLMFAVHVEESNRARERGESITPGISLPLLDDDWKD